MTLLRQEATADPTKTGISNVDDLSTTLVNMTLNASSAVERQSSIEGLAYTSLQPKVKEDIITNSGLVSKLVGYLKANASNDPSNFGILTIFANLTVYRPTLTEEQKRMTQLKSYANSQKPVDDNPLDDDKCVTARCKKVLDAGLVPVLLSNSKGQTATIITISVNIIHSLAKEQKHRGLLAQQGAVKLLLQSLSTTPYTDQQSPSPPTAAHALARILISVNPTHLFSAALPATSTIRPLTLLLTPDTSSELTNLLPVFESLLALTNLASMPDPAVSETIIRTVFATLEDLLLSSTPLIQRAAVELLCNLMAAPSCVAKFADGSPAAKNRLQILLALADVQDGDTRRAAGGALAMLTEWDAAVDAVVLKPRGVGVLLGLCGDESSEVRHRGFVCVLNVVSAPGDVGVRGVDALRKAGGMEIVKGEVLKERNRGTEVLGLGVEVLKKLV